MPLQQIHTSGNGRRKRTTGSAILHPRYLVPRFRLGSPLSDAAQIGVEVSVPQTPQRGTRGVRKDTVIWSKAGMTCWGEGESACFHPLAILEWKVHRHGRRIRNRLIAEEREWLREYCEWQSDVVAYAIEVDGTEQPTIIRCFRFLGRDECEWLEAKCG